jgi:prolyl-tRNA editing enzyme YbaK/EbsC (Cys-tRNA(Pro) deacylase)
MMTEEAILSRVKLFSARTSPETHVIELAEGIHTSILAAQALGVEVGAIAKSILFTGPSQVILVVASGDIRIDDKKLKAITGEKMKLADAEKVKEVTGFAPGGVCPFALATSVRIMLDESMKRFSVVYAAAGTAHSAVPVTPETLATITGGDWADLRKH